MKMKIEEAVFDKLAEVLKKHDLSEIEYKDNDVKIRLGRTVGAINETPPVAPVKAKQEIEVAENTSETGKEELVPIDWNTHSGAVKSPMVGTCYLAPEPGAQNFVAVGDAVTKDQPLLIIEAMKVMNLIKSPTDGKVVHIAVEHAKPVEYGQLLVVIE